MKALKKLVFSVAILAFLVGCSTTGGRRGYYGGGNNNAGIIAAGALIGAAILGHAFLGSKQAEVQKEAIRAATVSSAACNLGGKGSAGYESSEGFSEIKANAAYSAAECARIKEAQLQAAYGGYSVATADPFAYCNDPRVSPRGREDCRRSVQWEIDSQAQQRARDATRLRY